MNQPASLTRRAIRGLTQLLVAVAAMLCVSAWSLYYWQGWLFWVVFSLAVTLISFYFLKEDPALIERRLRAGPGAEKEQWQQIIQAFASVIFVALIVVPGLDHRFGWSHVSPYVVVAGDAAVALGLLIVFLVFRENSYTSATIEVSNEQRVISTGPYRMVRHPMYAGALLMVFGVPLALGSFWGLLISLAMAVAIVFRLIDEERYLAKNLTGYAAYRATTRYRLIPWIY